MIAADSTLVRMRPRCDAIALPSLGVGFFAMMTSGPIGDQVGQTRTRTCGLRTTLFILRAPLPNCTGLAPDTLSIEHGRKLSMHICKCTYSVHMYSASQTIFVEYGEQTSDRSQAENSVSQ